MYHKVSCMIEDKKMGTLSRALASAGAFDVEWQPVANVDKRRGAAVAQTGGTLAEQFVRFAVKERFGNFAAGDVKSFLVSIGAKPTSAAYVIQTLVKSKMIKRSKEHRNTFDMVTK